MIGRILVVCAAIAALAVPSAAGAKPGHGPVKRAAVKACHQERHEMGRQAFIAHYGRPAFKTCVRRLVPKARNAAQECRVEREDGEAFAAEYGTGRNAFGKCVSSKVSQAEKCEAPQARNGEAPASSCEPPEETCETPVAADPETPAETCEAPGEKPGEAPPEQ
jgi:hypothetical protein